METVLLFLATVIPAETSAGPAAEDIFGRTLKERPLVLVDWEGQLANPAIKIFVRPPADAAFPVQAVLACSEPRVCFFSQDRTGIFLPSP